MKHRTVLHFEFTPSSDPVDRANGWGEGVVHVQNIPVWYAGSDRFPLPIKWTWVDLLEYLGGNWIFLTAEQSYPYTWMMEASHPGDIWRVAERRWARINDDDADNEELVVLEFERRHNIAAAWKGISLPSIVLFRNGEVIWICVEGRTPVRAKFSECRIALLTIGNQLAEAFADSKNPRVVNAVRQWHTRGDRSREVFFSTATGLSSDVLRLIKGEISEFEFWEVAENTQWESGDVVEGELLAAARMTAGVLNPEQIAKIISSIKLIKNVPNNNLEQLNGLSDKVLDRLQCEPVFYDFLSGYLGAQVVRETLLVNQNQRFEVANVLRDLGVEVIDFDLQTDKIDAVAVWGARGPSILLNSRRRYVGSNERTRITLAHELAHIILDRRGGLLFCEVLGGLIDEYMERRARAFAAELLLPRNCVSEEWNQWCGSFGEYTKMMQNKYCVSKTVVCAQIYNSSIFDRLDVQQKELVEKRIRNLGDAVNLSREIKVEGARNVI